MGLTGGVDLGETCRVPFRTSEKIQKKLLVVTLLSMILRKENLLVIAGCLCILPSLFLRFCDIAKICRFCRHAVNTGLCPVWYSTNPGYNFAKYYSTSDIVCNLFLFRATSISSGYPRLLGTSRRL